MPRMLLAEPTELVSKGRADIQTSYAIAYRQMLICRKSLNSR